MTVPLATYVDRQGKPPAAPESMRIDSTDAVKLTKFFVALGFTAEKQTTKEGRQYILAKANGVRLNIVPSRTPQTSADWNMTLMVDDVAAAVSRATAAGGGSVASPIKDIPGGKKAVLASPDGHRVVVAAKTGAAKTTASAPLNSELPARTAPIPEAAPAATVKVAVEPLDAIVVEDEAPPAPSETIDFVVTKTAANKRSSQIGSKRAAPAPVNVSEEVESAGDSDGDDEASSNMNSPAEVRTLERVRIAAIFTAIGCGLFALSLVIWGLAGDFGLEMSRATSARLIGIVRLLGWLALLGGACCVLTHGIRRAKAGLVTIALAADVVGMMFGMIPLVAANSISPWFYFASMLMGLVSIVSLSRYLELVASEVGERTLPTVARVLGICFAVLVLPLIANAVGFALRSHYPDPATLLMRFGGRAAQYGWLLANMAYVGLAAAVFVRISPLKASAVGTFDTATSRRARQIAKRRVSAARFDDDDEDSDENDTGLSIKGEILLGAVRLACGISVAGILLSMLGAVVVFLMSGTSTQEMQFAQMLQGLLAATAAVASIVGKAFCVGKRAEFVDDGKVITSLVLDVVGFAVSVAIGFGGDLIIKAALAIVYLVCAVVSPILFVKYLSQVAAGLDASKLIASSRRAEVSLVSAIATFIVAIAVNVGISFAGLKSLAILGLIFVGLALLVGLVAFLLYAALLAAFASYKPEGNSSDTADE